MYNVIVNEVKNEFNWKEKIVLKLFTKTFIKVYNIARINTINNIIN